MNEQTAADRVPSRDETTDVVATNKWDWRRALPSWTWHRIALDGFPSWDKPDGEYPASVSISTVHGEDRSSREIAIETDDWCKGGFYYRDFTQGGTPIVRDKETYTSRFWFQFESDAKEFALRYAAYVSTAGEK